MKRRTATFAAALTLCGCMVGPDYQRPPPASDPSPPYKEATGAEVYGVEFRPALPRDTIDRGPWWNAYGDPVLDQLAAQVDVSNQTLKENEAAYRQAVALIRQSQSPLYPSLTYSGGAAQTSSAGGVRSTSGTVGNSVGSFTVGTALSWEIDVWGNIRRTIESDSAAAQASFADIAAARLSAQSSLVSAYFSLRIADEAIQLYKASVAAYEKSLQIVRNQQISGTASGLDVAQAETILEQARALYTAEFATRAQLEHSIAALVGKMPAEVTIKPAPTPRNVPTLDAGVPSTLLERRPDIAAAERTMASANAQIGVAVGAYYPQFTFDPSITFLSTMLSALLQIGSAVWSIGPQLAGTAFDAGGRAAQVEGARANYDKAVATYRQTVITAFQQVEDALAQQHYFEIQEQIQRRAATSAREAERLSLNQYEAGTVAYTTVIQAQTTALSAEQTLLTIRQNRFTTSATLITALGGGWNDKMLPPPVFIPGIDQTPQPAVPATPAPPKKKWWWPF